MANSCEICGKTRQIGHNVSHSNIKTKRTFKPNVKKVRVQLDNGTVTSMKVCTRCIRSGFVRKPNLK